MSPTDNPMRAALLGFIRDEPGLCFSELRRRLESAPAFPSTVGNGVLDWHLHRLERAGLIASHASGRFRRYYPSSGVHRPDAAAFAHLQSYGRWPIAHAIATAESLTGKQVQERLGVPDARLPALWRQLRLLCASGLLRSERLGREQRYHATPRLTSAIGVLSTKSAGATGGSPTLGFVPAFPNVTGPVTA